MIQNPQREILSYMQRGGRLTVQRAGKMFNTTELRRIVSRLRKSGYTVCADRQHGMTEDGRAVSFNEYYIPDTEKYGAVPSEHITGKEINWSACAYELTKRDKKNIFENLRETVDADSHGDEDGRHYQTDYKMYVIEAVHHYEVREEQGGDSYMGIPEPYFVVVRDSIEVVNVSDEDGKSYPAIVPVLNLYAKQNNL